MIAPPSSRMNSVRQYGQRMISKQSPLASSHSQFMNHSSSHRLLWVCGESFHKTVNAGTWEIPELELRHGDNTVSVTGEGVTTFSYREGRL